MLSDRVYKHGHNVQVYIQWSNPTTWTHFGTVGMSATVGEMSATVGGGGMCATVGGGGDVCDRGVGMSATVGEMTATVEKLNVV